MKMFNNNTSSSERIGFCRRYAKLWGWISIAMVAILLVSKGAWAVALNEPGKDQGSPYQIVELKGIEIPDLLQKSFDQLTLFSVKQGILIPIPFQLEDYDAEGYSWFKESGNQLLGEENVFDEHDSLFFRYTDSGEKLDDYNASFAQISTEIAVTSPKTGLTRYVYVSDKLNGFIHKPLTQYDQTTGVIESDYFRLKTNPNNFLIWNDFTYQGYQGESTNTLLDTLKIRMDAGVILEGVRVTLDNRNIKTEIQAVKQGPIRTVVLGSAYLTFASVPVIFLDLNVQIYPQQYRIDAKVHVPAILAQLLNTPRATITLDGNNLAGSLLRVSAGSKDPVKVDGSMSEAETALADINLPKNDNWIWLTTQKGFDIIAQLFIPDNFGVPISVFYIDNQEMIEKPERFAGQGPNVGYRIHDIPIDDTFHFGFSAFFSESISPLAPQDFMRSIASVPQVASSRVVNATRLADQSAAY
ncbi:MAG: hypothetical protein MI867_27805 [Pseudomonadales bacterium]|nr:hypothetical protein [Pseudomonadales bacterium]